MSLFRHDRRSRRRPSNRIVVFFLLLFFIVIAAITLIWYQRSLEPVNLADTKIEIFTVEEGMNEAQIGAQLAQRNFIRSALAFELYARLAGKSGATQAGGYELSRSMSVRAIVDKLTSGDVAVDLVTILPARRLDQIKADLIKAGYSEQQVKDALEPTQYETHPALIDKPSGEDLEGYLYPESFQSTPTTPLSMVIRSALDQMERALTEDVKRAFEERGLSLHEAIIIASIVEREVSDEQDRTKVAQVFLSRYERGMMLGSDPTALYGALRYGLEPSVFADTPYNTRIYEGLPPGPINNVSSASLRAVAFPADTDYLYFVSGDDGKTYFSRTLEEHEALTRQHCIELCRSY